MNSKEAQKLWEEITCELPSGYRCGDIFYHQVRNHELRTMKEVNLPPVSEHAHFAIETDVPITAHTMPETIRIISSEQDWQAFKKFCSAMADRAEYNLQMSLEVADAMADANRYASGGLDYDPYE